MIYYSIEDFLHKVEKAREVIQREIYKDVLKRTKRNLEHRPDDVWVKELFYCNGEKIDLHRTEVKGVTVTDIQPSVYMVDKTLLTYKLVSTVNLVYQIDKVDLYEKDILHLGDKLTTFPTYEEFLKYVNDTVTKPDVMYKGLSSDFAVLLKDKTSGVDLHDIFNQSNSRKKDIPTIPKDKLTTYSSYIGLDSKIKEKVDEILCPITIGKDDVEGTYFTNYATVHLDRLKFVKEHTEIHHLDYIFKQVFSQNDK